MDARKVALEQYLQQLTLLRIKDTRDLCEFLSTNVVERTGRKEINEAGWKEGYLTKRGKNFGGWKTRYFVLRGPILEYFDTVSLIPHATYYQRIVGCGLTFNGTTTTYIALYVTSDE